jgi:hypothetical protein
MKTGMFAFVFSIAVFALAIAASFKLGSEVTTISDGQKIALKKQTESRTKVTKPIIGEWINRQQILDSLIPEGSIWIQREISEISELDSLSSVVIPVDVVLEEPINADEMIEIDTSGYADIGLDEMQIEIDTTDLPR